MNELSVCRACGWVVKFDDRYGYGRTCVHCGASTWTLFPVESTQLHWAHYNLKQLERMLALMSKVKRWK